jgi:hypothetical protein
MHIKKKYILFFAVIYCLLLSCQNKDITMKKANKSGIEIFLPDFNKKIEKYLNLMLSNGELNQLDYIAMVRIYNTLEINNLISEKKTYDEFMNSFIPKFLLKAEKELEATLSKGMSYYSKKYNLYIGGKYHNNSIYKIKK